MLVLDSLVISALRGTLEAIRKAAEGELGSGALLRAALLDAQMRFEAGEIGAEELARIEDELLAQAHAFRAHADAPGIAEAPGIGEAPAVQATALAQAPPAEAPTDPASLTYVYAVVRAPKEPLPNAWPCGMPGGGPVRLLDGGKRLWLVASTVPRAGYDERAVADGLREVEWVGPRALAHESVVEQFLCAPAVLPMRLFALFDSDERALDDLRRHRQRIERILDRLAGREEWGLRLTWDGNTAGASDAGAADERCGADYLAHKRDLLARGRERLRAARASAQRLYAELAREAHKAKRRGRGEAGLPHPDVLLDATFLVSTHRTAAFHAALEGRAADLRDAGIAIALTGPWAPYNFV